MSTEEVSLNIPDSVTVSVTTYEVSVGGSTVQVTYQRRWEPDTSSWCVSDRAGRSGWAFFEEEKYDEMMSVAKELATRLEKARLLDQRSKDALNEAWGWLQQQGIQQKSKLEKVEVE